MAQGERLLGLLSRPASVAACAASARRHSPRRCATSSAAPMARAEGRSASHSGSFRDVGEFPISEISIEPISLVVVREIEIRQAIAIHVANAGAVSRILIGHESKRRFLGKAIDEVEARRFCRHSRKFANG